MNEIETKGVAPVVKTVRVRLSPDAAFHRFTADIGDWWPMATHSVGMSTSQGVTFGYGVGEPVVEELEDGSTTVWGTVVGWDPPRSLNFTWHPGREPGSQQLVELSFVEIEEGTEVTLTHSGWEALGERGAAVRDRYDDGWNAVLDRFEVDAP